MWRAVSAHLVWDLVLRLWARKPALEIAGMKGFEGGGGRILWVHARRAEWFCSAAGPSSPEVRNAPSLLWVTLWGTFLYCPCLVLGEKLMVQITYLVMSWRNRCMYGGGAGYGQPLCISSRSSCVP